MSSLNLWAALKAPFSKGVGEGDPTRRGYRFSWDSGFSSRFRNAAGTRDVDLLGSDATWDVPLVGGQGVKPAAKPIRFNMYVNGDVMSQSFWIAPMACRVTAMYEIHKTQASAGTVTGYVEKLTGTQTAGQGVSLHDPNATATTFNLRGDNNTLQTATVTYSEADRTLAAGDRLGFVLTGTPTSAVGICITVYVTPACTFPTITFTKGVAGGVATTTIFTVPRPMKISSISYCHKTAEVTTSNLTIQVKHETGTTAPGSGDALLAAGFTATTAVSTVQTKSPVAAYAQLAAGDRLSIVPSGSVNELAGACLVIVFEPVYDRVLAMYNEAANANLAADHTIFIADRDYEVICSALSYTTASTSNVYGVTIDTGTTAPGAGTACTGTKDTVATAATVYYLAAGTGQAGSASTSPAVYLKAGDRLGIKQSGTKGSLAGLNVTVSLKPI